MSHARGVLSFAFGCLSCGGQLSLQSSLRLDSDPFCLLGQPDFVLRPETRQLCVSLALRLRLREHFSPRVLSDLLGTRLSFGQLGLPDSLGFFTGLLELVGQSLFALLSSPCELLRQRPRGVGLGFGPSFLERDFTFCVGPRFRCRELCGIGLLRFDLDAFYFLGEMVLDLLSDLREFDLECPCPGLGRDLDFLIGLLAKSVGLFLYPCHLLGMMLRGF